ncbi:MAG: hypothetical protein ACYC2R_14795 [Burkholderiales bacterium]
MQGLAARFITCLAFCSGLLFSAAGHASGAPQPFMAAAGVNAKPGGNAFAAAQTVTSPYGGSYSVDTGQWSGNSGTVAVTYNNFKLPNGWGFNGSWSYTGSVASNSILTGTLTGTWSISGLDLGSGAVDLSYNMKIVFAAGQANLTMTYTLPSIPGTPQTVSLQLKQQDMIGFLL